MMSLDLSNNRLTTLPSALLLLVPQLNTLLLSGNAIEEVDAEAVSGASWPVPSLPPPLPSTPFFYHPGSV